MSPIVNLPDKPTLTIREIADAIGVKCDTIRRVLKRFKLRRMAGIGRGLLYSRDDVVDMLEDLTFDPRADVGVMNPEWREKVARRKRELREGLHRTAAGNEG